MMQHVDLMVVQRRMAELAREAEGDRLVRAARLAQAEAAGPVAAPGTRRRIQRFLAGRGWLARPATKPNPTKA